ncbi:MAG: energy transducer TonB [Bacteroidia bacterium]
MKKKATENSFIHRTSYPGGIKALREFVDANIKYPEEAIKHGISGTVALLFDVDKNGKVSKVKVKHGLGFGCDEEAVRLVKMLKYASTKNRGLFVVFHETININFNLKEHLRKKEEEEMEKRREEQRQQQLQQQPQVTYNYTITEKKENTTHTYTIKLP